jgi:LemA protein
MRYNDTVRDYNVLVRSFPMNMFAGMFHFTTAEGYPVSETAKVAPKVDFSGIRPATGTAPAPAAAPAHP